MKYNGFTIKENAKGLFDITGEGGRWIDDAPTLESAKKLIDEKSKLPVA